MDRETVKTTIRSLVEKGVFGPSVFKSVAFHEEGENDSHFASTIAPLEILVDSNGKEEKHKAILKLALLTEASIELFAMDELFKNEVITYTYLLPILEAEKYNIFPKMLYGNYTNGEDFSKDMIILDDVSTQGFILSHEKLFLDIDHLSLIVSKLGKFHGLSHIAKNNKEFKRFCSELSKSKFEKENHQIQYIATAGMHRALKPILDKNDAFKELWKKAENVKDMMDKLYAVEEPFSVLCHGDFNRNNIFFKYENNRPVDVLFFDLQLSRYTSPAVDLSFVLYMNTTKETRKSWDRLLEIYWEGLTSVCTPGFSFEQFLRHFASRAIYGFVPSAFFLGYMMTDDLISGETVSNMTKEEKIHLHWTISGEPATKAASEIAEHLLEKNYIEPFLSLWKK